MDYKIKVTKNYNAFELSSENRPVVEKHVEKLAKVIKKNGYKMYMPIKVVDMGKGKYLISDGQHRFLAAKKLGCEFSYLVFDNYEVETFANEVMDINDVNLKWSVLDYLRKSKDEKIKEIVSIVDDNKEYQSFILHFAGLVSKKSSRQNTTNCDIEELKKSLHVCDLLCEYVDLHQKTMVSTIKFFVRNNLNLDRLLKNIEKQSMKFVKCATTKQFTEMIEYFYNYDYPKANRIKFDI